MQINENAQILHKLDVPLSPVSRELSMVSFAYGAQMAIKTNSYEEVPEERINICVNAPKNDDRKIMKYFASPVSLRKLNGGDEVFEKMYQIASNIRERYPLDFNNALFHLKLSDAPYELFKMLLNVSHKNPAKSCQDVMDFDFEVGPQIDEKKRKRKSLPPSGIPVKVLKADLETSSVKLPEEYKAISHASSIKFYQSMYEVCQLRNIDGNDSEDKVIHNNELNEKCEKYNIICASYLTALYKFTNL